MFCIHCGNNLIENAQFCAHCGKPVPQIERGTPKVDNTPVTKEWEYYLYRVYWNRKERGEYNLIAKSENDVRLDCWGRHQSWILPNLQEDFFEKGWEAVGSVGPGNFNFVKGEAYAGTIKYTTLSMYLFLVELRRPARPRTEMEKQLLGDWQEPGPQKGLFGRPKKKERMVFYENLKYEHYDRSGQLHGRGVFFTTKKDEIQLMHRDEPGLDGKVTVTGNNLVINREKTDYVKRREYERVIKD